MSDSTVVKLGAGAVVLVVLLLFLLVSGPGGILDAFSALSIATGLFVLLALFVLPGGGGNLGVGVAVSSILIVGGFLVNSTTGFTSIAAFLVVFSAILVFVYGLTEKNEPENNLLLLAVAASIIIFVGGRALPAELSVTATGLMLAITAFGVMVFTFSKFSEAEGGLKWALLTSAVVVVFGLLYTFAGFLPGFVFAVLVLFAFAASKIFPDITSDSGAVSFVGTASAVLIVFFLSSVQGLFPGLLRAFSLLILLVGLVTIAFFLRIGEREVPGITSSGLLLGTILTLAGLYLALF